MLPNKLCTLQDYVGYAHYLKSNYQYVIAILEHDLSAGGCLSVWIFDQPHDTVSAATKYVAQRIDTKASRLVVIEVKKPGFKKQRQILGSLPDAS